MGFKFAIVEDATFVRTLLRSCLEDAGGECAFEASKGTLTFEELEKLNSLDFIVLDFVLPDKNGLDLAQIIREKSPNTVLIGCTSLEDYIYEKKSQDLGFFKIIKKPFTKVALTELLTELGLISNPQVNLARERKL